MKNLEGLIFDLDGTLLDSAADLRQAINETLTQNGRVELSLQEVKNMTGDGMLAMLKRAFVTTGAALSADQTTSAFNQFIEHYARLKPDRGQLYPYVVETLEFYRSSGIKLALCTNKQEQSTSQLMDDLRLTDYFDFIAGGDTFPVRKPHAGHVRGVLNAIDLPAANVVMVGDSPNDVIAAKGAGVECLAVTHGYGANINDLEAHGIISNFLELPSALLKMGFEIKKPT